MSITIKMDVSEGWVKRPRAALPQSVYKCTLVKVEENDNGNHRWDFKVAGGESKGAVISKTIGAEAKKGNAASLLTVLVALGATEDKAKEIAAKGFNPEKLYGKTIHIYCGQIPDDADAYQDIEALPGDVVKDMIEQYGLNGAAGASSDTAGGDDDFGEPAAPAAPAASAKKNGKKNGKAKPAEEEPEEEQQADGGGDDDPLDLNA